MASQNPCVKSEAQQRVPSRHSLRHFRQRIWHLCANAETAVAVLGNELHTVFSRHHGVLYNNDH